MKLSYIKLKKEKALKYFYIIILFLSFETAGQINFRYVFERIAEKLSAELVNIDLISVQAEDEGTIKILWNADNLEKISRVVVERMSDENMVWKEAGYIPGSEISNSLNSFIDDEPEGNFYSYRLKAIKTDRRVVYSKEVHTQVNQPERIELFQNYPNPFNPSTTITFRLYERSFVTLKVFNLLGNEITTLINEEKSAGVYDIEFNVNDLKNEISNGTYFYRLQAGDFTETKKMIYMK